MLLPLVMSRNDVRFEYTYDGWETLAPVPARAIIAATIGDAALVPYPGTDQPVFPQYDVLSYMAMWEGPSAAAATSATIRWLHARSVIPACHDGSGSTVLHPLAPAHDTVFPVAGFMHWLFQTVSV
jgi:hypothetical protein